MSPRRLPESGSGRRSRPRRPRRRPRRRPSPRAASWRAEQGVHDRERIVRGPDLQPDAAGVQREHEPEEPAAVLLDAGQAGEVADGDGGVELEADTAVDGRATRDEAGIALQSSMRPGMASAGSVQAIGVGSSGSDGLSTRGITVEAGTVVQPQRSSHAPSGRCCSRAAAAACSSAVSVASSTSPVWASASFACTTVRSRSWIGPHSPPSHAIDRSAISSRVHPSCLARAMNARRSRVRSS